MRKAVFQIASRFADDKSDIVNLACLRGDALDPLVSRFDACNRLVGVAVSQPMPEAARKRFRGYNDCDVAWVWETHAR
jgi:hypothetical protein